jgi:hypothetical protein
MIVGKLVLGRQLCAEINGAAQYAIAQDKIDLLRLCFAEPVAQGPTPQQRLRLLALYLVFFSIQ